MLQATLFNIQRFSTEDGPGIRTTLFFKGCPLDCKWCHNPEGIRREPEIIWYDVDCLGCGECVKSCNNKVLKLTKQGLFIDRKSCKACGTCVEKCDVGALELIGKKWGSDSLLNESLKDKVFYETSKGGITLSGGEPMIYYDFLMEFLPKAKGAELHIALDTSGFCHQEKLINVLKFVDLVLFDIKCFDPLKHKEYTGVENETIISNAIAIAKVGTPMWIRTPLIPKFTDSNENVKNISKFISDNLPNVERYDLLAFSNLCISKYKRLGKNFPLENEQLLSRSRLEELVKLAKEEGVDNVKWSGLSLIENSKV